MGTNINKPNEKGSLGAQLGFGLTPGAAAKRGLLAFLTGGTSEIKTGAGQYGDETLADSLFPKTINDWALEDRQRARGEADEKTQAEANAAAAQPVPDLADKLLRNSMSNSLIRQQARAGRRSSFLTGAMGDVTKPLVSRKTALGQ